jgi:ribose transport system ATP-binding protein
LGVRFVAKAHVIMSQSNSSQPLLEMRGMTKRFPGIVALSGVDFSVRGGEIHALLGQNGAGKSTLMKILAGVYPIEEGELRIGGQPVTFSHPRDALRIGIGLVYQDLSLVPHLSVADNIFLGREASFVIDERAILRKADEILADLGVKHVDVSARVGSLPLAQQQLVEIAKVLSYQPRILVLDEPTAALAEEETALLFGLLKGLRQKGIAIIFISHRFKEVIEHCDRATVLRNGLLVDTIDLKGVAEEELIELTIGERIEAFFQHQSENQSQRAAEAVLEVDNLSVGRAVRGISFCLYRGEIVGITGLLGAGQNELARALFGIQDGVIGSVRRNGHPINIASPQDAVGQGIGLLTEHRKREGLVLDMSVKENITLPSLPLFRRASLFIDNLRERQAARSLIEQLQIKTPSASTRVLTLSGGNQQKAILAKWLLRNLDILIFIAPTQGIDVGAKAEIYQQLGELARSGKSIIVVSEDLIEILGISDRIFVMYNGQLAHIMDRADATEELLSSAIQGNVKGNVNGKYVEPAA